MKGYDCNLQLPQWLWGKAWDLQTKSATGGWQYNMRISVVRPNSAPVFQYAYKGMLDSVLEELRSGRASIHDCNSDGWTVFHYSCYVSGSHTTLSFLLLVHMQY